MKTKVLLIHTLFVSVMILMLSCANEVEVKEIRQVSITANVTSRSALNVRVSPSTSANVVGVAHPNETVDVLLLPTEAPNWAKIRTTQGVEGYSSLQFLEIIKTETLIESSESGEYFPTELTSLPEPYAKLFNDPIYYMAVVFGALAVVLFLMYYYQTPITRNADFTERLRQMFENSWIGNATEKKNPLWVIVAYLVAWGGVVWLMWMHETDTGFRIELNFSGGFIWLVSLGVVGVYAAFVLSQMYINAYDDNFEWVYCVLFYLGSVLSFWFSAVLARAIGQWLAVDIYAVSWIEDAFWAMLLTVAAVSFIEILISILWVYVIVRLFMRPFHNLSIHVVNLGVAIGMGYTSVCFVYEQFTGFDCVLATFFMTVVTMTSYGIMVQAIQHIRCPNCHSYSTSTLGVFDLGFHTESHRESNSIPDYDIKTRHSGAVVSDAKEHGVRTNTYRDTLTTHRCKICDYDWEVKESQLVDSRFRADRRSWTETYLDD